MPLNLFFMDTAFLSDFDFLDLCLLLGNFVCGLVIAYQDWQTQKFSKRLTFCLCLLAVGWCWKQRFFPFPLCPIAGGLFLIWGIGHFAKKRWMGEGDIFLFLQASCYFFLNELPAFLMICGSGGVVTFLLKNMNRKMRQNHKNGTIFWKAKREEEKEENQAEEQDEKKAENKEAEKEEEETPQSFHAEKAFPFVPSIVLAQWVAFILSVRLFG